MNRCHVLVEGQTEEAFANQVLRPHLLEVGFVSVAVSVLTTKRPASGSNFRGGVGSWATLKRELRLLLGDRGCVVTTMIDLYGLPTDTPGSQAGLAITNPRERVESIEAAIAADLGAANFVPHVMLHEFETLVYADPAVFAEYLDGARLEHALRADLRACQESEFVDNEGDRGSNDVNLGLRERAAQPACW